MIIGSTLLSLLCPKKKKKNMERKKTTYVLHLFNFLQTRVQASTLSFPEILAKLPELGARGLYRGSIPAILGQFSRFVSLCLKNIF